MKSDGEPRQRDLTHLPVFGREHANCETCDLKAQCDAGKLAAAHRPANWNGIMVVGEGPGTREVAENRPFVGESGRLLKALFESYGANLDDCYITNATLALPAKLSAPNGKPKGGLMERFPSAVYACLPRLEAEIAAVRPRVVLAFGAAALVSMTGYEEKKLKRVKFACDNCDPHDRKLGPVIECSARHEGEPCKSRYWADEAPLECTKCGASLAKQKPKRIKCPVCHSLKTRQEEITLFKHDYKINEVAGAVIDEKKHAWADFGVKYIVPTWHPSFILRGGEKGQFLAKPMQKHIRKALFLAENDRDWGFEWDLTSELGDERDAQMLLDYVYATPPYDAPIAVDIETEAWHTDEDGEEHELDARKVNLVTDIKVIGFASRAKGYALVVDTRNAQPVLLEALKRVLTDSNVRKDFHHGNYDCPVIRKIWGFEVQGYTDDTLIMHHVLYPDEPHKLSHVSFSFTYARIWKPPRNLHGREAHETFEDLAVYNARDCMLTDENYEYMNAALDRKGLRGVYDIDMRSQQQALTMHYNGMAVDMASIEKIGKEALQREAQGLEEMRKILKSKGVATWADFNPNKPVELGHALYDVLGNNCAMFTTTGAKSTAKEAIARLEESPFKTALLLYRDANTYIRNNYERVTHGYGLMPAKNLHVWPDGRIRALWKAFGTRTGRFSSNPNYQNWPKWTRALIISPNGRRILGCDYDQLELRIMAALSGDPTLIEKCLTADDKRKLEPDHDPHSFVARLAFGDTYLKLDLKDPKHDKDNKRCKCQTCTRKMLRDIVKRVIYGLMYGSGDQTVLDAIYNGGYDGPPITLNMIARVRSAVFKAFPRVLAWRERAVKLANQRGYIESPLYHRRRHFPLGDIPVTEIYNYPIQSGGADIINTRVSLLLDLMHEVDPTAMYIAQVHDAIFLEVDAAAEPAMLDLITNTMTWTTSLYKGGPEMTFSAQASAADNWKDAA